MRPAGGELMRSKAETRSVPLMDGVWAVPLRSGPCNTAGGELMGPKAETRSVLRRAVSSARIWKVSCVWYAAGHQQEGPLPSHCCCGRRCRRKGAPSIEKPPVKEHGLWAQWKAKAKSLRKNISERLEERCHNSKSSVRRRHSVRGIGWRRKSAPCRSAILNRSSESTHFLRLRSRSFIRFHQSPG